MCNISKARELERFQTAKCTFNITQDRMRAN